MVTLPAGSGSTVCRDNGTFKFVACNASDARLKTNVAPLTDALNRLTLIRGVTFDWNQASQALISSTGRREIGVLAQEVEAVFPELVTDQQGGYKTVAYEKLTAVLIEAVKELKAQNDSLKQRVEQLESANVK